MTIGHLTECLAGKASAVTGRAIDGGPFSEVTAAEIGEELKKQGMHPFGKEVLFNGMTGTRLEALVFMGPTFYQRLKVGLLNAPDPVEPGGGPLVLTTAVPLFFRTPFYRTAHGRRQIPQPQ